jgi:lycopene beta-cyclase
VSLPEAAPATRRTAVLPSWAWALPPLAALAGSVAWAPTMTYAQFHLAFTLPWLALLGYGAWRAPASGRRVAGDLGRDDRFAWWALAVHGVIAFLYTTPWDNYLVYRGVWGYPPGRVLGTIGYVPLEEYAFFLIQTLASGLLLFALARASGAQDRSDPGPDGVRTRVFGAALLLGGAAAGVLALMTEAGTYLGLIAAWALPVLALQWGFGGDLLVRRRRLVALGVALPTLYLWIADRLAIGWSIWWIEPGLTVGWRPLGLPVEEALFFLVTNALVVFGLVLALHPVSWQRLLALAAGVRRAPWRPLLVVWALAMIPTPLVPEYFAAFAYASTGVLALAVLVHAWVRYGAVSLALFAVAFTFGVLIEALGASTGVPFGRYTYTAPGPAILGVPLLVPLGWWAFAMIAIAVSPPRRALLVAPLALVAWDLGLDPLMVEQGFWVFAAEARYYGVPVTNFVGWWLAGTVLVALLSRLEPRLRDDRSADLRVVFVAQAFLVGVGLLVFGVPWAALVSVTAMAVLAGTWRWGPTPGVRR